MCCVRDGGIVRGDTFALCVGTVYRYESAVSIYTVGSSRARLIPSCDQWSTEGILLVPTSPVLQGYRRLKWSELQLVVLECLNGGAPARTEGH